MDPETMADAPLYKEQWQQHVYDELYKQLQLDDEVTKPAASTDDSEAYRKYMQEYNMPNFGPQRREGARPSDVSLAVLAHRITELEHSNENLKRQIQVLTNMISAIEKTSPRYDQFDEAIAVLHERCDELAEEIDNG